MGVTEFASTAMSSSHFSSSRGEAPTRSSVRTVFLAFLKLGLTSFGGPIAHLGYFRTEFVERLSRCLLTVLRASP
jgi:hypothetical protein